MIKIEINPTRLNKDFENQIKEKTEPNIFNDSLPIKKESLGIQNFVASNLQNEEDSLSIMSRLNIKETNKQ